MKRAERRANSSMCDTRVLDSKLTCLDYESGAKTTVDKNASQLDKIIAFKVKKLHQFVCAQLKLKLVIFCLLERSVV